MRKDKEKAISLRKSGQSYAQISSLLGVSKSTLSIWLKDLVLSLEAKNTIANRVHSKSISALITRNKKQTEQAEIRHLEIRKKAEQAFKKLSKDKLFITGVSLYWGEGYKKGSLSSKWKSVDFANSDPEMIAIMVDFFKKFLNIEVSQMRLQIMLHKNNDIEKAAKFWQDITKIPRSNFIKTYSGISRASLQKRNNKLQYGTVHIRINNVDRFFRIIGWIDGLKKELINNNRGVAQLV